MSRLLHWSRGLLIVCLAAGLPPIVVAAPPPHAPATQPNPMWTALEKGGCVILLRHDQKESAAMRDEQTPLSKPGKDHAAKIAASLAGRPVQIDQVISSDYVRCQDNAKLAFPKQKIELDRELRLDRSADEKAIAHAVALIQQWNGKGNLVLVSHSNNISEIAKRAANAGKVRVQIPPGFGGALVVKPAADGKGFTIEGEIDLAK